MKILLGYEEKYNIPFVNVQGHSCVVRFLVSGWSGGTTELTGGAKPFVLGEFNNDEDYFKPIRPQQATIEIAAKAATVTIDDFLADNDSDIIIKFDLGDWAGYWYGYLSQEDMQETWIDTIHILTLRATEGLGELQNVSFPDDNGVYSPFTIIEACMDETVNNLNDCTIINNLFHTSMVDTVPSTGLDQCLIDTRTFETQPTVFENMYTVLEKINKSWSQTVFQYYGKWFFYRLPEIFKTPTLPLYGFYYDGDTLSPAKVAFTGRYDIEVGVGELVYPIAPEMLRFLKKPAKETKITFQWENFEEIVCNETFSRGTLLTESASQLTYSVDCWTFQKGVVDGTIGNAVTTTGTFERRIDYIDGKVDDNYIVIGHDADDVHKWIRSANVYCNQNDRLTVSFQHKWGVNITAGTVTTAYVLLYGDDSTYYTLDSDGTWSVSNSSFTVNVKDLEASFSTEGEDWMTLDVECDPIPKAGYFVILLYRRDDVTGAETSPKYFKDLKIDIIPQVQDSLYREIQGDWDKYTIASNVNSNFDDEIFLDDADSKNHKGAIFQTDGITLTGDEWYRRDYNTERFTFKRHNALAHWFMNRSYKSKIDANFFGITYLKEGVEYPIGLMNTINFVDDAPTKTFAIVNLKEIDFMSCQWSATLIEVYDTDVPDDVPGETDVHTYNYIYGNKS